MTTLSESASKRWLARYGVPVVGDVECGDTDAAVRAADSFGYPVVVKLTGDSIAHKTERGLVRLALADADAVRDATNELFAASTEEDGTVGVLVAPMLRGGRELIAGIHRDPQFGPCVMVGIGGVFAEALGDVAFRLAPLGHLDASEMIDDLEHQALLGALRGDRSVDRDALAAMLTGLGAMAVTERDVISVDVNPLIVVDGAPVAVDALVQVRATEPDDQGTRQ